MKTITLLLFIFFCSSFLTSSIVVVNPANFVLAQQQHQQDRNNKKQQQQLASTRCVSDEQNHKDSIARHLNYRAHPQEDKSIYTFSSPLSDVSPNSKNIKCTVSSTNPARSYPIYSLQHLNLAPSPSPFYTESYRTSSSSNGDASSSSAEQNKKSLLRMVDRGFVWIEDKIPVIGPVIKLLRSPLVVLSTHIGGFMAATQIAVSHRASPESLHLMHEQLAPQTAHLLQFFNYAGDAIRFAFFRQIVDVYVSTSSDNNKNSNNNNNNKFIRLSDGVVEAFAVALPPGVSKCNEIKVSPFELRSEQGTSKSIQCRDPYAVAMFHSPTEFVNSVFAWIPRQFEKVFVKKNQNDDGGEQRELPTCTIDTTFNSAEATPQCVFVACKDFASCTVKQPEVRFEQRLELDVAVPFLLIAGLVIGFLRPYASRSALLRWTLCTLCGVLVLAIMLGLLFYKFIENNNTAKYGFAAAAGITGLYAASSGIITYVIDAFVGFILSNWIAATVFAIMCLGSVYIAHRFFGSSMPMIIDVTMRASSYFLLLSAGFRNPEFVFLIVFNYLVAKYILFRGVLRFILLTFFGSVFAGLFGSSDKDAPRDTFPAEVYKLKEHSLSKAVANPIREVDAKRRLKAYEVEGGDYTAREMKKLYAHLRKDPTKYVNRLQNPNLVFGQAGVGTVDEDEN